MFRGYTNNNQQTQPEKGFPAKMLRRFTDWKDKRNRNFIMDESEYSGDEHARLSDIFNSIVGKPKYDKQNYTQITRQFTSESRLNDNEIYIRDLAYRLLESVGLQQNKARFMIEYWRHRLFAENKSHIFSKHRDSFGPILAPVNTCIFYLRKDKTFKGSNLEIYGLHGKLVRKPIHTFETDNKIVLFDGSAFHKVLPYSGFGIRDCIVVMFSKDFA